MHLTRMAAQVFGVVAVVGCLTVATTEAGEFRRGGNYGGHHNGGHGGGHHGNGRHGGGFRPWYGYAYGYGGGFRPGFGYGGYRPGGYNGGFIYNRPNDGRPPIFIPRW